MSDAFTPGDEFVINTNTDDAQHIDVIQAVSPTTFLAIYADSMYGPFGGGPWLPGPWLVGQLYANDGTPIGTNFLIDPQGSVNGSSQSDVTELSHGNFAVTWQAYGPVNTLIDVFARTYGPSGQPLTEVSLINSTTAQGQGAPRISSLSDGRSIIVWTDASMNDYASVVATDIRARLFSAAGQPIGPEILVNTTGPNWVDSFPEVVTLSNGGFIIAWNSGQWPNGSYDYFQIFDGSGSPVGANVNIGEANEHEIIALAGGRFAVRSITPGNGAYGNTFRVFAADGRQVGETTLHDIDMGLGVRQSTAALAGGGFVSLWGHDLAGSSDGLRGQIFDKDGLPVGDILTINSGPPIADQPRVAALPNGGFVVTWTDQGETSADKSEGAIKAQVFRADGSRIGAELLVNTTTIQDQSDPHITALGDGGFAIAWNDSSALEGGGYSEGYDPAYIDVRGRVYNWSGTPTLFDEFGNQVDFNHLSEWQQVAVGNGASFYAAGDGMDIVYLPSAKKASALGFNLAAGLSAGDGNDRVRGADGDERILGGGGADLLDGGSGSDTLAGGGDGDSLSGGSGRDTLLGKGGNDEVRGGGGKDIIEGGSGRDTADYSDKLAAVSVTLHGSKAVSVKVGGKAEDSISDIENLVGGSKSDRLEGDGKANRLAGGKGGDTLAGGDGKDEFVFSAALSAGNVDLIKDFKHDIDLIALDDAIFGGIGAKLTKSEFYAKAGATAAHDGSDRVVYDKTSGKLFYDADGKDGGEAVQFAVLSGHPALGHGDFVIV